MKHLKISKSRRGRWRKYLIIRERNILGYREYLGPLETYEQHIHTLARIKYGKEGHTLTPIPWSKATDIQRRDVKEEE